MSIDVFVEELDESINNILISVKNSEKEIGSYNLTLTEYGSKILVEGYLRSRLSNNGTPRLLIEKAVEVLQDLAKRTGKNVLHKVKLSNSGARIKLPKLYKEFGYEEIGIFGIDVRYKRVFEPKN